MLAGLVVNQPVHGSHEALVVGAVASAVTVKLVAADVRCALFVAVTLLGSVGSAAPAPKV